MNRELTSAFSDRLSDLIKESNKKIREIADDLDIGTGTLSNYQNNISVPNIDIFSKIADYFEVSYDYLLGKSDSKLRENADIANRLGLTDLSVEVLEHQIGFINQNENHQLKERAIQRLSSLNYIIEEELLLWDITNILSLDFDDINEIHCYYRFEKQPFKNFREFIPTDMWLNMRLINIQYRILELRNRYKDGMDSYGNFKNKKNDE